MTKAFMIHAGIAERKLRRATSQSARRRRITATLYGFGKKPGGLIASVK
jgi:hypothetical protein